MRKGEIVKEISPAALIIIIAAIEHSFVVCGVWVVAVGSSIFNS